MRFISTLRLLLVALALYGLPQTMQAQIVLNGNDSGPGSLRNAITIANAAGTGVISFDASVTSVTLTTGEIVVGGDIGITGPGVTISGNNNSRIFNVAAGASLGLTGLTLTEGFSASAGGAIFNAGILALDATTITESNASGVNPTDGGGAIANIGASATLTITNLTGPSAFTNNSATGAAGSGGAIISGPNTILDITDVTFTGNSANRAGGALETDAGSMATLTDVIFNGNTVGTSPGNGGAFHITGSGNATITGGAANNNTAGAEGGAFWNGSGTMTIDGTSFENNVALGADSDNGGGALFNVAGTMNVSNATVSNNSATGTAGSGGGAFNQGIMTINNSTFSRNSAVRAGGGIEATPGTTTTLNNTDFIQNITGSAPGNGGALHITGNGNAEINGGRFFKNVAASEGGALWNGSGVMDVNAATIDDNIARGDDATNGGGGIFNLAGTVNVNAGTVLVRNTANGSAGSGGGIFNNDDATLNVTDAIIRLNSASRAGGGIEDRSGDATVVNISGTVFLANVTGPSPGNGAAIHITGDGDMNIAGGSVERNVAASEGGGFWVDSGVMTVTGTSFSQNEGNGSALGTGGGALFSNGGELVVNGGARFFKNRAPNGAGSGGAILLVNGGTLSVDNATFDDNTAARAGGAIEDQGNIDDIAGNVDAGPMEITNTEFVRNSTGASPGNGGGIHITGPGDANVTNSLFRSNVAAAEGGGYWNGTGTSTITNTRFLSNRASGANPDQGGGGIFNLDGGTLVLTDVDLERNVADGAAGSGGGLLNRPGAGLTINGGTFSRNTAVRAGGGIEAIGLMGDMSIITLTDVDFVRNRTGAAPGNGGGIHITGPGNMDVTGGFVFRNFAAREGGGFWNGSGTMNVTGTQFRGNAAVGDGADDGGGALFNNGGELNLTDAVIRDNRATGTAGSGGGILNLGTLSMTGGVLLRNDASRAGGGIEDASDMTVALTNVRVEGNTTGSAPGNGGGLHVTGGADVTVNGGIFIGNLAAREGGGLWNDTGNMTITNTIIRNNRASGAAAVNGGGGVFQNGIGGDISLIDAQLINNVADGASGSGGGALVVNGGLSVSGGEFRGNRAPRAGGGIEDASGDDSSPLLVTNVDFVRNSTGSAPGNGGAIHITGSGNSTIMGSVARDNVAIEGGGFWNGSGVMTVTQTAFFGNEANGPGIDDGGGALFNNGGELNVSASSIYNNSAATNGGGIANQGAGILNVDNTNISSNDAGENGGGIYSTGSATLVNLTVAGNAAQFSGGGISTTAPLSIGSSIVTRNISDGGADLDDDGSNITSAGFNIISDGTGFTAMGSDFVGTTANPFDARLAGFVFRNDNLRYFELKCGSVAIDGADPSITSNDQVGTPVQNGRRDIGSFESQRNCGPSMPALVANDDAVQSKEINSSLHLDASNVTVYPNPVGQDFVNVNLPEVNSQTDILLLDGTGRQLGRLRAFTGQNRIELADYPNGTYIIRVVNDKEVVTKKVMVQR